MSAEVEAMYVGIALSPPDDGTPSREGEPPSPEIAASSPDIEPSSRDLAASSRDGGLSPWTA
ncbi:MAG TPA: hypothetical protein VF789_23415 [Thermoanaerobaculia bacterium]